MLSVLIPLPALFAGVVQGVTGFGAGVLLMLFYPLWFSIAQSSAMSQFLCTVLCFSIVLRYRQHVNLKQCLLPIALILYKQRVSGSSPLTSTVHISQPWKDVREEQQ